MKKFARDVGLIGITRMLLIGLSGFILLPILTKNLSAHDYGIWVQIIVTVSLFQGLSFFGLTHAMTRFLSGEDDKERIQEGFFSTVFFIFLITSIISLFIILFPDILAKNFFDGDVNIVRITGLIILTNNLAWSGYSFFRAFSEMKIFSFFIILENIGLITLIYISILSGFGVLGTAISLLIIKFVIFSIAFFIILSRIGLKFPHFTQLKSYLKFGLPIVPSNISHWVINSVDRYLIGYFIGAAAVGYYNSGYILGNIVTIFASTLVFVLFPTISKLYEEGKIEELKSHLSYSIKYFLLLGIPFFFGTILLSNKILNILTTSEIASNGHFVSPLIALGAILQGLSFILMQAVMLTKKTKIIGIAWIISASVNFSLNLLLIPLLGIMGAAIAAPISYVPVLLLFAYHSFTFNIDRRFIIKSITASVFMSSTILGLRNIGIDNIVVIIISGIIIYFSILIALKGFSKEEILFLKNLA